MVGRLRFLASPFYFYLHPKQIQPWGILLVADASVLSSVVSVSHSYGNSASELPGSPAAPGLLPASWPARLGDVAHPVPLRPVLSADLEEGDGNVVPGGSKALLLPSL